MTFRASPEIENGTAGRSNVAASWHAGGRRVLAAALLLSLPLIGQTPGVARGNAQDGPFAEAPMTGGIEAKMEARRLTMLNIIRQKGMISDADKLLHLAQELSEDANAGGTKMSAAERMHKAAEIEKLAKNVKEKMTYAIGAPENLNGPFNAWQH